MKKTDDGGQAFPYPPKMGMTLRQWYAGMALQGIISNPHATGSFDSYADDAFKYANAMIAYEKEERENDEKK